MQNFFQAIDNWTARLLHLIVIVASIAVAGLVFFQVISRYVFEWSIIGLDELSLLAAMWLYMAGALIASRRSEHLVVDFLPQKLRSPLLLKIHQRVIALIMLGTTLFFLFLGWKLLKFALRLPQYTEGLDMPQLASQSAILVAAVGCTLYVVRDLITGNPCHNPKEKEED
ncbi:TRAP transporter small permease [Oceanospirillum linum]|uniref:TRAP transporter small permease protein n=1 Tax=Oceanospirillum linum TaxID=966 RepID=A0A1T1H9A3_OCELI|nr:TRAP transporter small permease subunit [Oceanospirillum linum]OOV86395.1 hypothetical protein BTA35_0212795 [Oceanospirillum linum]SEG32129.1 TRAP-type C4-dicarboxylate transport system, small permease component [Oleiphilus messinensis]SMP28617.1 TRAP-type C4-dicarboxylate transport system, small permease component [Oceanospirillum linum]